MKKAAQFIVIQANANAKRPQASWRTVGDPHPTYPQAVAACEDLARKEPSLTAAVARDDNPSHFLFAKVGGK